MLFADMQYGLWGVGIAIVALGAIAYIAASGDDTNRSPSVARTNSTSFRTLTETDGVKHSIPLDEILSGGPGKDGIPSIDDPKFVDARGADFLQGEDPGIGLVVDGDARFYPYSILVWHEIVNDTVGGRPALVTYCPLCATGIVFDRRVDGVAEEFGVSGKLWESNLLMYNRAANSGNESLWSQVLGEAVVGAHTGKKLVVIPSDIIRWSEWRRLYPNTKVLSTETGATRDYGRDPYGDYYSSRSIMFGSSITDTRLHPKALVIGVEVDGVFKAYPLEALSVGATNDTVGAISVTVNKDEASRVIVMREDAVVPHIPSFWFSWLAVHPDTELYAASTE